MLPFISNSRESNYFKRVKPDHYFPCDQDLSGRDIIKDHEEISGGNGYIP